MPERAAWDAPASTVAWIAAGSGGRGVGATVGGIEGTGVQGSGGAGVQVTGTTGGQVGAGDVEKGRQATQMSVAANKKRRRPACPEHRVQRQRTESEDSGILFPPGNHSASPLPRRLRRYPLPVAAKGQANGHGLKGLASQGPPKGLARGAAGG